MQKHHRYILHLPSELSNIERRVRLEYVSEDGRNVVLPIVSFEIIASLEGSCFIIRLPKDLVELVIDNPPGPSKQ